MCVFILIDSRHERQPIDFEFMQWLGINEIPFVMVFTKTDKLKKGALEKNVTAYNEKMLELWEELPNQFVSSSLNKSGRNEILDFIEETNKVFPN